MPSETVGGGGRGARKGIRYAEAARQILETVAERHDYGSSRAPHLRSVDDLHVTSDETYMTAGYVAGYRWKPPAQDWTKRIPATVITVSDCLADFLPHDQDPLTAPWHPSLYDAINAVGQAPLGAETAHILAMSVPTAGVPGLTTMIDQWIGDYPHPIRMSLTRQAPTPAGKIQGFEVLGFEAGRFHTWLCYGLHEQAVDKLGIHANDRGLLATLVAAQRVADMANSNHGTHDGTHEEITWFPALITEYDTDQHSPGSTEPTHPPQLTGPT